MPVTARQSKTTVGTSAWVAVIKASETAIKASGKVACQTRSLRASEFRPQISMTGKATA